MLLRLFGVTGADKEGVGGTCGCDGGGGGGNDASSNESSENSSSSHSRFVLLIILVHGSIFILLLNIIAFSSGVSKSLFTYTFD